MFHFQKSKRTDKRPTTLWTRSLYNKQLKLLRKTYDSNGTARKSLDERGKVKVAALFDYTSHLSYVGINLKHASVAVNSASVLTLAC